MFKQTNSVIAMLRTRLVFTEIVFFPEGIDENKVREYQHLNPKRNCIKNVKYKTTGDHNPEKANNRSYHINEYSYCKMDSPMGMEDRITQKRISANFRKISEEAKPTERGVTAI